MTCGGKRARGVANDESKIPVVVGHFQVLETNPVVVQNVGALNGDTLKLTDIIENMSMDQLTKLDTLIDKYERNMSSDTSMKALADALVPELRAVEETFG